MAPLVQAKTSVAMVGRMDGANCGLLHGTHTKLGSGATHIHDIKHVQFVSHSNIDGVSRKSECTVLYSTMLHLSSRFSLIQITERKGIDESQSHHDVCALDPQKTPRSSGDSPPGLASETSLASCQTDFWWTLTAYLSLANPIQTPNVTCNDDFWATRMPAGGHSKPITSQEASSFVLLVKAALVLSRVRLIPNLEATIFCDKQPHARLMTIRKAKAFEHQSSIGNGSCVPPRLPAFDLECSTAPHRAPLLIHVIVACNLPVSFAGLTPKSLDFTWKKIFVVMEVAVDTSLPLEDDRIPGSGTEREAPNHKPGASRKRPHMLTGEQIR
ncbi:hypothetical protein O181_035065 [Austropuccinia psidii MF-1]|uniref:Uncharacterized protein n=1 Tax=Austropuccinia psidii MF-1 TaxID=1389203 RepID=A0A9Q3D674_9BASI|nr:hypothetical protein [Austropuccinia psidii MF-1]